MTIPVNWTLYINIAIVALLVLSIVMGYVRGFFLQLIDIVSYILAFFIANRYSAALAGRMNIWPKNAVAFEGTVLEAYFYDKCNYYLWFVVLFFGVLILTLILRPVFKAISEIPFIKEANKALGMVLGVISFVIMIVIVVFLLSTPLFTNGQEIVDHTLLSPIKSVTTMAFDEFSDMMEESGIFEKLLAHQEGKTSEEVTNEEIDRIIEFFQKAGMSYQEAKEAVLKILGKNE